jgi:hypothetical protein
MRGFGSSGRSQIVILNFHNRYLQHNFLLIESNEDQQPKASHYIALREQAIEFASSGKSEER